MRIANFFDVFILEVYTNVGVDLNSGDPVKKFKGSKT